MSAGVEEVMVDYSNTVINEAIEEYIHKKRDRDILKRRLIDGITFEKLAEEFDLSVRNVKYIVYKGQDRIFKHLK